MRYIICIWLQGMQNACLSASQGDLASQEKAEADGSVPGVTLSSTASSGRSCVLFPRGLPNVVNFAQRGPRGHEAAGVQGSVSQLDTRASRED